MFDNKEMKWGYNPIGFGYHTVKVRMHSETWKLFACLLLRHEVKFFMEQCMQLTNGKYLFTGIISSDQIELLNKCMKVASKSVQISKLKEDITNLGL